ncbi:bile acid:sodium symporter family protein [Flavisolibacter nicotianae]|uniref:bile acid:sodium symporter family protein n=1 Tax=Flavisolibacter nicotianae TaxID=2364882 RepID=UPI000EB3EE00|nr:bile acid:sodium symporter family protein [Flavisolibacter nicotianae]
METAKRSLYSFFYAAAAVFLLAYLGLTIAGLLQFCGWLLLAFFVSLALAFRSNQLLRGLSYTVIILGVVSLAMYHPQYFKTIGDFKLSALIVPLLQIIMFGMGTELSLKDFAQVLRMPKGILVGIVCHYTIMPLVGFAVASLFNFPSEIAAGIILVGCCPSGLASNVMCYLARANLALSVSVTTISTLLAPFLTPTLMRLLGGSFVEVHFLDMMWDITKIVIIPIVGGLGFHYLVRGKFAWLDKAMPLLSMVGIALILVVITAAGRDNLLKVGVLLVIATFIHNVAGFFLGYWSGRLLKFSEKDCRTIALEVGMQNSGLASGLALTMGKLATAGLAPAIFGPMMNVTGSFLSSWWHNRLPQEDAVPVKEEKPEINVAAVS